MTPTRGFATPCCFERVLALDCRPWRIRKHTDTIVQRHDPDHTGYAAGRVVADLLRRGAFHRLAQDGAIDHARHLHVDAVLRAAVHLERNVDASDIRPDEAELRGVQRLECDHRCFRRNARKCGDLAIGKSATRFGMYRGAGLGAHFRHRDVPMTRGVLDEDVTDLRAELSHLREIAGYGCASG